MSLARMLAKMEGRLKEFFKRINKADSVPSMSSAGAEACASGLEFATTLRDMCTQVSSKFLLREHTSFLCCHLGLCEPSLL